MMETESRDAEKRHGTADFPTTEIKMNHLLERVLNDQALNAGISKDTDYMVMSETIIE